MKEDFSAWLGLPPFSLSLTIAYKENLLMLTPLLHIATFTDACHFF